MKAKIFSLAKNDFVKAFAMAVIGAFVGALYPWINAWLQGNPIENVTFKMQLAEAVKAAVGSAVVYIMKNYFSNSAGQPLASEKKAEAKKVEILTELQKDVYTKQ